MRSETIIYKDFLSINEFAKIVGMSIGTLRYYDNEDIFRPAKRGEGAKDKFRYYSPTQIKTVKMIRVLTEIGVPLQAIRELCDDRTPDKLIRLFSKYKRVAEDELRFLDEVCSIICTFLELLNEGISITEDEIHVTELEERQIIMGGVNDFAGETGFVREFTRFCNSQHEPKINLSYPVGGYFDSMDVFLCVLGRTLAADAVLFSRPEWVRKNGGRAIFGRIHPGVLQPDERPACENG